MNTIVIISAVVISVGVQGCATIIKGKADLQAYCVSEVTKPLRADMTATDMVVFVSMTTTTVYKRMRHA